MGRLFGKMPFDIQACGPVLSTYRDSGLQVKLSMPGPYFVFSGNGGELSTPEFRFMSQESEVVTYWYGGDNNGTKAYPWYFVETKLILKREAEYMIFAVIIPAVAFVIVAYVGFWVDRDAAPARFVPPVLLLSFPSTVLPVCLLSLPSQVSKETFALYLSRPCHIGLSPPGLRPLCCQLSSQSRCRARCMRTSPRFHMAVGSRIFFFIVFCSTVWLPLSMH